MTPALEKHQRSSETLLMALNGPMTLYFYPATKPNESSLHQQVILLVSLHASWWSRRDLQARSSMTAVRTLSSPDREDKAHPPEYRLPLPPGRLRAGGALD